MIKTRAEELLELREMSPPEISPKTANVVSQYRRDSIEGEMQQGLYREKGSYQTFSSLRDNSLTQAGVVSHSGKGIYKLAQSTSLAPSTDTSAVGSGGSGWRGSGGTTRQLPELYSPLWLNSNLNLPRDRATVNAWCRSFFALNPLVQNAITLHSTYPISKLNIKCKNGTVEKFFAGMIEELDLMSVCTQIAQEFWTLGEAFIYGELDERTAKWSRLLIQNPDYITVKRSVIAGEPIISLRPDENLKRLVMSHRPGDVQQRQQLDPSIIEHVRNGENIPLNNFYVSHLARRISPYEIRGTGLPVSCFRALMLFDKMYECHDIDTEILTNKGFKKIFDLVESKELGKGNKHLVAGFLTDLDGIPMEQLSLKNDVEIACYNAKNDNLEYHKPNALRVSQYSGNMKHFIGEKIDTMVTPNHKMYLRQKHKQHGWSNFELQKASELKGYYYKFKTSGKWVGKKIDSINILNKEVDIKLFLKFLGHLVSEGCFYKSDNYHSGSIIINQLNEGKSCESIKSTINKFAETFDLPCHNKVQHIGTGYSTHCPKDMWEGRINNRDLVDYLSDLIGIGSYNKHLPRWVLDLDSSLLEVLLEGLVEGDGSVVNSKYNDNSISYRYSTISKQLADDVYELVYKCGFVPNIHISNREIDGRKIKEYIVLWSNTNYGVEPLVRQRNKENGNGGGANIRDVDYTGPVWCFDVPTGLFVTRRNGKITIQGNSKYVQADNMITPLTLVKIGNQDFRPTPTDLEQWRDVFECHDEQTEVLTDQGFKRFDEVIEYSEVMDGTYDQPFITNVAPKQGIKIACFNRENEQLEYHEPSKAHIYNYDGEMYHFNGKNLDVCVTPNHDMWCRKRRMINREFVDVWEKVKASDINQKTHNFFRSVSNWSGKEIESVKVLDKEIPIELYLKFLGYLISEGCLEKRQYENQSVKYISINQSLKSDCLNDLQDTVRKFASYLDIKPKERITKPKYNYIDKSKYSDIWNCNLNSSKLLDYFVEIIGSENGHLSDGKVIPSFVFELSPRLLKILLDSLVAGDGSVSDNRKSKAYKYYTCSELLASQIQEIVFKCGYSSNIRCRDRNGEFHNGITAKKKEYSISWSTAGQGSFPLVYKNIEKRQYSGKVWCFTVPTGLFITRRNGKITIQGNSAQYDKDFKIFTHDAVNVERVGYGQGIYDISNDLDRLVKLIYIGLMVPSVLMDGSDTTYATGSVALDVLRQRYVQFRNMLGAWLKNKIFAPISKLNDFYEYIDGEKTLIVPEVDWNHMSLFDMSDYIQNLANLTGGGDPSQKRVSLQTLYRSLGLEYNEEMRKMRYEDIQDTIRMKEYQSLQSHSLTDLRALGPGDEIEEVLEAPEGQSPYEEQPVPGQPGAAPMLGGGLPPPPGGGGGIPPAPIGGGPKPSGAPPAGPIGGPGKTQPPPGNVGIGPGGVPKPPSPT